MNELVTYIATALVDDPDAVKVERVPGDEIDVYELTAAPDDLGKVIGRGGRTARALRSVIRAGAAKVGGRAHLEILE